MSNVPVNMVMRHYDHFAALMLGDTPTPGFALKIDRHAPLTLELNEKIDVAEVSFNRYVVARARGDDSVVGVPAFILRGFRHRNFFVAVDSNLTKLADLAGKRLGTNSWPDTGTMWARAAMRDAGVDVGDVHWTIGTLDANTPNKPPSPNDAKPPSDARFLTGSENLLDELRAGRLDAITTAFAPESVFAKDGWLRRLVPDYRAAEAEYRRRTGIYPGFHIVAVRREFALRHPLVVPVVYGALRQAFDVWTLKAKRFAEATPWAMAEFETLCRDFPDDTPPFGMESAAHRKMVAALCHEQHAQGLVPQAADPAKLFADFESIFASART